MKKEYVKKWKSCIFLGVFFIILGIGIYYAADISSAASVTTGVVSTVGSNLNVRSGPGSEYGILGTVNKGAKVTIIEEQNGWYKITFGTGVGYVSKDYIANVKTEKVEDPYWDELVKQGFPSSYADALSKLHKEYPNWIFEPVITGLEWNTVIEQESKLGRNLVQSANNDAQKSTAPGAYSWMDNKWIGYDGAGWVCASSEMVAYCMDPRNFLDNTGIFQFATTEYQSYQNSTGVKSLLEGSFMAGNYIDTDGVKRVIRIPLYL